MDRTTKTRIGINKKQASRKWNAVSCQQSRRSCGYHPILATVVTRGPRERFNCNCSKKQNSIVRQVRHSPLTIQPTVTTTQARCPSGIYTYSYIVVRSNTDAKLDFKVPGYDDYMYLLISNFTSAGTPYVVHPTYMYASASTKETFPTRWPSFARMKRSDEGRRKKIINTSQKLYLSDRAMSHLKLSLPPRFHTQLYLPISLHVLNVNYFVHYN